MRTLNWHVTKSDGDLIDRIVKRADDVAGQLGIEPIPDLVMDLTACHANGTPLQLQELLDAPRTDFVHDVWGIHRHLNRETGRLEDHFLPRLARPRASAVPA